MKKQSRSTRGSPAPPASGGFVGFSAFAAAPESSADDGTIGQHQQPATATPIYTGLDSDIAAVMRRVVKTDVATKLKALQVI